MSSATDAENRVDRLVAQTGEALKEGKYPLKIMNDPDVYREELRRIFAKTWVFVGHESEFEEPGDYARRYIGEDPFIIARDEDGEMHAFLDSCMHRGAQFCTAESGNTSHFRCPYHGWTYKNDGTLQGAPHLKEAYCNLDTDDVTLEEATLSSYQGLLFARIADEGPSLEEYLGDFKWYLDVLFGLTKGGMTVIGEPHRWESDHDWKTSSESFAGDSYHVLTTHQAGLETSLGKGPWEEITDFPDASYLACTDRHSGGYYLLDDEETFMGYPETVTENLNPELSEAQRELAGRSVFHNGTIFPNMSYIHGIQSAGWGGPWLSLRVWQPRGPGKVEVINWWLIPDELTDDEEFKRESHRGWESLSPGGAFEADDLVVWNGISDSCGSQMLEERGTLGNIQLGFEGMSDGVALVDDPVHGPADVTTKGLYFDERHSRTWYGSWQRMMAENGPHTSDRHLSTESATGDDEPATETATDGGDCCGGNGSENTSDTGGSGDGR